MHTSPDVLLTSWSSECFIYILGTPVSHSYFYATVVRKTVSGDTVMWTSRITSSRQGPCWQLQAVPLVHRFCYTAALALRSRWSSTVMEFFNPLQKLSFPAAYDTCFGRIKLGIDARSIKHRISFLFYIQILYHAKYETCKKSPVSGGDPLQLLFHSRILWPHLVVQACINWALFKQEDGRYYNQTYMYEP